MNPYKSAADHIFAFNETIFSLKKLRAPSCGNIPTAPTRCDKCDLGPPRAAALPVVFRMLSDFSLCFRCRPDLSRLRKPSTSLGGSRGRRMQE